MDLRVYSSKSGSAAIVVAHGAGAGQTSPFLVRTANGLAARGVSAATFDFGYIAAGKHVPDPPAVLEACWRDAIAAAKRTFPGLPLFIGGKSMGGRIASQVAAQGVEGISGLIFLGYPLHPPGRPQQRRDAHLPGIAEPMLFVQGSRDTFGTADEIRELLPRLRNASLHEVTGGDHSFKMSARGPSEARSRRARASGGGAPRALRNARSAPTAEQVLAGVLDVVARWMSEVVATKLAR